MGTYQWTRSLEYELAMDHDTIGDFVLVGFLLEYHHLGKDNRGHVVCVSDILV